MVLREVQILYLDLSIIMSCDDAIVDHQQKRKGDAFLHPTVHT